MSDPGGSLVSDGAVEVDQAFDPLALYGQIYPQWRSGPALLADPTTEPMPADPALGSSDPAAAEFPKGLADITGLGVYMPSLAESHGGLWEAAQHLAPGAQPVVLNVLGGGGNNPGPDNGVVARGSNSPAPQAAQAGRETADPDAQLPPGVDWDFIRGVEGNRLRGAVPPIAKNVPSPNSGITVGHGFDLHGRSAADLHKLGLSSDLVAKLTAHPEYETTQGQAAQDFADAHPLTITPDDVQQIDQAAFPAYYAQIANKYNADAQKGLQFENLPRGAQTAIVSLGYNYGPGLNRTTPNFWHQVINGQWQDAHDNLMDFHDSLPKRREAEARQMASAIPPMATPRPNP